MNSGKNNQHFQGNARLDFIKTHEGPTSLNEVLERSLNPRKDDAKFKIHKFCKCMKEVSLDTESIKKVFKARAKSFKSIKLVKITNGIYAKILEDCNYTEDEIIKLLSRKRYNQARSIKELEELHDKIIEELNEGMPSVYALNMEKSDGKSLLSDFIDQIDPNLNRNVGIMRGINVPTYYMGGPASITELHHEDGMLESINGMMYGEENAKIWLIIDSTSNNQLKEVVTEVLSKEKKKCTNREVQELLNEFKEGCGDPFGHKQLVFTINFLKRHNIRFEVTPQKQGDLILVNMGILHQVISLSLNFCQAVNKGSAKWSDVAHIVFPCTCPGRQVVYIKPNERVAAVGTQVNKKIFTCERCVCSFTRKDLLSLHEKEHTSTPKAQYLCSQCNKQFATEGGLNKHYNTIHSQINLQECDLCGLLQRKDLLPRHREAHKLLDGVYYKGDECPYCEKKMKSIRAFRAHASRCGKANGIAPGETTIN